MEFKNYKIMFWLLCVTLMWRRGADTGTAVEPTRGLVHYEHCLNFIHPGQPIFIHDILVVKLLCLVEVNYACVKSLMP